MISQLPPGLVLLLGALLVPALPGVVRKVYLVALPALALALVWTLPDDASLRVGVLAYDLELLRVDAFSRVFALIFCLAALLDVVFSLHVKDTLQHVAGLAYAGSAVAAVFVGDLIGLFVFWELTAITSVFLIWARRSERSYRTGMRYLVVQVASGVLLLFGAVLHYRATGSLAFGTDAEPFGAFAFEHLADAGPGVLIILVAFGIKAAFPLLHGWLPDAYPEATPTGTVWLSAFTTKLAIYALARGFAGTELLVPIGALMAIYPLFWAAAEDDLRKVLSHLLNNQLGFMVVGVGIGTELALDGVAAHAFAHIAYKGLLFMAMGAVLHRVGTVKASELGGLWRRMPYTTVFCIVGAASSLPLLCGFVTKSMIISAAAEEHLTYAFLALTLGTVGVFYVAGVRVPYRAFFGAPRQAAERATEAPRNMLAAMAGGAFLCVAIGCFPQPLYALLPFDVHELHWVPYDASHVVTTLQLALFAALAFWVGERFGLLPKERPSTHLDVDWLYRGPGKALALGTARFVDTAFVAVRGALFAGVWGLVARMRSTHSPRGQLGEPWPIGDAALWSAGMLIAFLLLAYLG